MPPRIFEAFVNKVLNRHRVAYKMINGEVVPFTSDELHTVVVEPALRLLHGLPEFSDAEAAYQKALKEISTNDAADAITDAGTALQELLKALGCSGHSLGQLIPSAKSSGLLGSYDTRLTNAIESMASWATKERNDNGDAHKNSPAVLADAWLMVHVVGALVVRLVDPAKRGA